MVGFFTFLFVLLAILLVLFILIQPGKGDMGLGSLSRSSQMLFGGSGGQSFFEKATWAMGVLFIGGALLLTLWKTNIAEQSRLTGYQAPVFQKNGTPPVKEPAPQQPVAK